MDPIWAAFGESERETRPEGTAFGTAGGGVKQARESPPSRL